jgi:glycosyltransferase involved in cell wall biosynthesis
MTPVSDRLRILHVMPSLAVGGAEQMATHLMVGLSHTHSVGAVGLGPNTNSAVDHRLAQADIPRWHLSKRTGFDPRMFSSLNRVFREFRPQVIHTHLAVQRYVFPLLLRAKFIRSVHTVHNLAEHETDAVGRIVHWLAFRSRVHPIGISREVDASVKRLYGIECRAVIPNCIPVEDYLNRPADGARWREQEGINQDAIVFTSVARLEPQKNPFLLLEAFSDLNDSRSHLVLVGAGSLSEQLAAFVRVHKLGRQVHLLGQRDNVPAILAASDVFMLGSNWEGNPLAVMEAMATGLPIICTAVGGVPELVETGQQGILVSPGDRSGFVCAMRSVLSCAKKRLAMAHAARTRAIREFGLERMVQGYSDLYESVMVRPRNISIAGAATHAAF